MRGDFTTEQDRGLVEIWGDDIGKREHFLLVGAHGVLFQQWITAACHHDRVDHEMKHAEAIGQFFGNHAEQGAGIKHAGFHRGDRVSLEEDADLRAQDLRGDGLHFLHPPRNLGDHAGDSGETVDAIGAESFEVCLDSCSAGVVGTRDGQNNRWRRGAPTHGDAP